MNEMTQSSRHFTDLLVSATVRHQQQGSLSSVTLPSANQQQFRCTFAKTWESVHAVRSMQARGYPRVFQLQFYIYSFKFILPEFVSYLGERGVLCVGNG